MNIFVQSAFLATLAASSISPIGSVSAAVTVFGNGAAQICAAAARQVSKGETPGPAAFSACQMALDTESLSLHDLAGTRINRGVLLLARQSYADAKQDFDAAVALMPDIGEAYTDRGAALVGLGRYADAIADIDRGLALTPGEPEKAYFNRALADEGLDDVKSAYRDYLRAAQLKPGWTKPQVELARFTVIVQSRS
jgi:tetratricopeptide (TPR) repeat protein